MKKPKRRWTVVYPAKTEKMLSNRKSDVKNQRKIEKWEKPIEFFRRRQSVDQICVNNHQIGDYRGEVSLECQLGGSEQQNLCSYFHLPSTQKIPENIKYENQWAG